MDSSEGGGEGEGVLVADHVGDGGEFGGGGLEEGFGAAHAEVGDVVHGGVAGVAEGEGAEGFDVDAGEGGEAGEGPVFSWAGVDGGPEFPEGVGGFGGFGGDDAQGVGVDEVGPLVEQGGVGVGEAFAVEAFDGGEEGAGVGGEEGGAVLAEEAGGGVRGAFEEDPGDLPAAVGEGFEGAWGAGR